MKPSIAIIALLFTFACSKYNQNNTTQSKHEVSAIGMVDDLVITLDTVTGKISTLKNNTDWAEFELDQSDTGHFSFLIARIDKGDFTSKLSSISPSGSVTYKCGFSNILYWPSAYTPLFYNDQKSVYFHLFASDSSNIEKTIRQAYFYLGTMLRPSRDIITNITIGPFKRPENYYVNEDS